MVTVIKKVYIDLEGKLLWLDQKTKPTQYYLFVEERKSKKGVFPIEYQNTMYVVPNLPNGWQKRVIYAEDKVLYPNCTGAAKRHLHRYLGLPDPLIGESEPKVNIKSVATELFNDLVKTVKAKFRS